LPPSMRGQPQAAVTSGSSRQSSKRQDLGPAAASSSDEEDAYGPALPPGFVRGTAPVKGPSLPPVKGPSLPPGGLPAAVAPAEDSEDSDGDADMIGPRPPPRDVDLGQYAASELERRASSMREKLDAAGRPVELAREDWMLELPPDRAKEFGLGARQFRRTAAPERGDTSGWTDVAGQEASGKERPAPAAEQKQSVLIELASSRRDERMSAVAERLQASRKEALLDTHLKERKKAKKEAAKEAAREGKKRQRQEFDRNRDLGANRFDEAQRSAAIKRSRGASDMFGSGEQKYL